MGDRSKYARFLRKRLCAWAKDQLGVRGQPADRRAACWIRRERLLRPASKSLQFYWFDDEKGRDLHLPLVATSSTTNSATPCSTAAPAFLRIGRRGDSRVSRVPGRPYRHPDGVSKQRVPRVRPRRKATATLRPTHLLSGLAQQFGEAVIDAPYLRSALNTETMKSLAGNLEPHTLSEVLTGTMFDILKGVFAKHREAELERSRRTKGKAERSASAWPQLSHGCRCSRSSRSTCCRPAP